MWDRWYLITDEKGNFVTQRQEPKLALVSPTIPPEILEMDPECVPADSFMSTKSIFFFVIFFEPFQNSNFTTAVTAPGLEPLKVPLLPKKSQNKREARVWSWNGHGFDVGKEASDWLSGYLGKPVRLLQFDSGIEFWGKIEHFIWFLNVD